MIKVIVSEKPNNSAIFPEAFPEAVIFNFEDFNHKFCQDLIEICLKNDKIIKIFNAEE